MEKDDPWCGTSGTLLVPRARTATGQRSFAINGSRTWNSLLADLRTQIRRSAPSSVISRPTCFSSSLRCCWQVGSAPFVRRRCDCLASSASFTNIQTYLLTYLLNPWMQMTEDKTRQAGIGGLLWCQTATTANSVKCWRSGPIAYGSLYLPLPVLCTVLAVRTHSI